MKRQIFIILTPGFAKDETDTTCIPSLQSFVKNLVHEYPQLRIIVIATDYPFKRAIYQWNDVEIIPLSHQNSKGVKRYWQLIVAYIQLRKFIKKKHPIGILSLWGSYTSLLGHFLAKYNSINHYCWLRGQDVRKGNRVMQLFKHHTKSLITLSEQMNNELEKNYGFRATRVIPMAVDISEFGDFSIVERDIDIIGVGSLIPLKQWEVFVDVISKLVVILPELKCVLCGDGIDRCKLKQLIVEKGLIKNIDLCGQLPHNEVLDMMGRSRILLHPSSYEGYAAVFTEALYAGCHCISFVDPEQNPVEHWHIAKDKEHMISLVKEVLQLPIESFSSIRQYEMKQCVNDIMQLYNVRKTASISFAIAENESLEA